MRTGLLAKTFSICIVIVAALFSAECFADTEQAETIVCETPSEYTEAVEAPDPEGSSKFALKRIMVFVDEGDITNDHDALSSIYYTIGGYYLLEYQSPSETKAAYKALSEELGDDKVFADEILYLNATDYEKNPQIVTNATPDNTSVSYGVDLMHLDKARDEWKDEPYPDDPVIVAVIDSGIRSTHEMFKYEEWDNNVGHNVQKSRLLIYDDASFADPADGPVTNDSIGHGTHVAGIIADGTSKQVKILPIKVFPDAACDEEVYGTTDNLYPALLYARDHGADIINMSLGYGVPDPDIKKILDPLFRDLREKNNIMCVAAAGNDKSSVASYPSTSFYVESVSALKYDDVNKKIQLDWGYTNYGDRVNFAAPGTKILSASNKSDTGYVLKSGTSMATPHIAAAMAMVKLVNLQYTEYIPMELIYFLEEAVWESVDNQPEGMYYYEEDPAGGHYGMPVFDNSTFFPINVVFSIRYFKFKLKQKTFTYTGKKNYFAEVEDLATWRCPVTWHVDGYYDYERKKGEDFWELSHADCDTVGTAVLGLRGIYPNLIGDKYYTYTILPKGTVLAKSKAGKKKIKVKWNKQAMKMSTKRINGYEIQLATNKKFTKNKKTVSVSGYRKTSKTVSKLKAKKKYYIRIRTFMNVRGKVYRSKWSKVKTVKTL